MAYSELNKKELIDLVRKTKEENQNLIKEIQNLKNEIKHQEKLKNNQVPKQDVMTLKREFNQLLKAFKNSVELIKESQELNENIIKGLQGITGMSTTIYTKHPSVDQYINYANTLIPKKVEEE